MKRVSKRIVYGLHELTIALLWIALTLIGTGAVLALIAAMIAWFIVLIAVVVILVAVALVFAMLTPQRVIDALSAKADGIS